MIPGNEKVAVLGPRGSLRLENYLRVCSEELKTFGRMAGHDDVHGVSVADFCAVYSEVSGHTGAEHV